MLRPPYPFDRAMDGYGAWSGVLFDRVAHLTGLNDEQLGRELARVAGRQRPFSRPTISSWRAGHGSPPLEVFLIAVELSEYDLPFVGKLAPTREFAEARRPELPKAVGSDVRLRVVSGALALSLLFASLLLVLNTRSTNPQVWVKAAQHAVETLPMPAAPEGSASIQAHQAAAVSPSAQPVVYVDRDERPTPTPSSRAPVAGSKPASGSSSPSTSRPLDPSVAAADAAFRAELLARLRARQATPTPTPAATPEPPPDPTPPPAMVTVSTSMSTSGSTPASSSAGVP